MPRKINPITGKLDELGINAEKLRGRLIDTTAPTNGQVLVYDSGTNTWIPGSGAVSIAWEEVPSGALNGVNVTYVLSQNVDGQKMIVHLNGITLERVATAANINEFSHVSGSDTITLGAAPISGDLVTITYTF